MLTCESFNRVIGYFVMLAKSDVARLEFQLHFRHLHHSCRFFKQSDFPQEPSGAPAEHIAAHQDCRFVPNDCNLRQEISPVPRLSNSILLRDQLDNTNCH